MGVPFISVPTKSNVWNATLFTLGVDSGKSLVMGRLSIEDEGVGFVHYPMQAERGFNEEFFKQLTSEVLERTFEKGVVKMAWKKIRDRNEALDCAVYATAALEILSPNFDYLAEFYKSGGAKPTSSRPRGVLSPGITI